MSCQIGILSRIATQLALALVLMTAGSALAEVNLSWTPADTTLISPGETARISIHIDEVVNFRTIEVTVSYDTTVVKSLGGGSGSLYTESGYFVFDGFEEEPGSWHGYAVIMGAGEYLTGPGEVLFWNIEGAAPGISPIISVEALIYDESAPPNLIPDVVMDNAVVIVEGVLSSAQDYPRTFSQLTVAPNPFNPRTRISFDIPAETRARLTVFDMRGRQIAILLDGSVPSGTLTRDWNGTDDLGRSQPGGIYLFQLQTPEKTTWAKGILVK